LVVRDVRHDRRRGIHGPANQLARRRDSFHLRTPERNGAIPTVGALGVEGLVLLHVGTAFVVPTDGQLYDPTDGAVTVPTEVPDCP
jgi:hypothetical protein